MTPKQLTAAGYTKVKVSDLKPGDVVRGHLLGEWSGPAAERVVEFVRQERKSTKAVHFIGGGIQTYGNASKAWVKGA